MIKRPSIKYKLFKILLYLVVVALSLYGLTRFYTPMPNSITMSGGPEGSMFSNYALQYQKRLEAKGIELIIKPSTGSYQNLQRLLNEDEGVDIGFVQGGVTLPDEQERVMSLGSMFYVPLSVYSRKSLQLYKLSELKGKRIGVGEEGSGTYALAVDILRANGIGRAGDTTEFVKISGNEAVEQILNNEIDAVFFSGDSASFIGLRKLRMDPNIAVYEFDQPDAYVRRFRYLNKIEIPTGTFDLSEPYPAKDLIMLAPTVELLARSNMNPALVDLLVDISQEIHAKGTVLQNIGEFPALMPKHWPLSQEAKRYLKDGKNFLYHYLPFGVASFLSRMFILLAPVLVILAPLIPVLPKLYRWRIETGIYRQYEQLITVEREMHIDVDEKKLRFLCRWVNEIEQSIMNLKIAGSYTEQVYILRQHLESVRERLQAQLAEFKKA